MLTYPSVVSKIFDVSTALFFYPQSLNQAPCYWFLTSNIFWIGSWASADFHGNNNRSSEQNPTMWCSLVRDFRVTGLWQQAWILSHKMECPTPTPPNLTYSQLVRQIIGLSIWCQAYNRHGYALGCFVLSTWQISCTNGRKLTGLNAHSSLLPDWVSLWLCSQWWTILTVV